MSEPLLHPYERAWLADDSRYKIGMWARQTGKTFTCTLELVLDCVRAEADGDRRRWVILSRGERQAREAMEEGVQRHLQALSAAFRALDYDWDPHYKAHEVRLPGGSRITALPASPDTARGYSANVLLDEFAFHRDSREIWRALFPVVSAGHMLRVVSTPNGKGNMFYTLMTDQELEGTWSRHAVDIHRAVAEGLPRDIDELRRGVADPDAWSQEYELQWLDEASSWLPYDLIHSCEDAGAGDAAAYQGGDCFVGIDIAARNDLYVLVVLERVGDVLWLREMVAERRLSFAAQEMELQRVMRDYRVVRVAIDQTGMGEQPVERAQRAYGNLRVEGVLFTPARRLDMATILRERMEDRRVRLPEGDAALRADLHAIRRVQSATGHPRLMADGETDGHADRFWALALAATAAADPPAPIEFDSTGARRAGVEARDFEPGLAARSRADDVGFGAVAGGVDTGGF